MSGVVTWACGIGFYVLFAWLRYTDERDWRDVGHSLWEQMMRDEFPNFRSTRPHP